jgi:DNA-binding MarR family transcriptional regulator
MVVVHRLEAGSDIFRELAEHRRRSLTRLLDRLTEDELTAFLTGLRALRAARLAVAAEGEAAAEASARPTESSAP